MQFPPYLVPENYALRRTMPFTSFMFVTRPAVPRIYHDLRQLLAPGSHPCVITAMLVHRTLYLISTAFPRPTTSHLPSTDFLTDTDEYDHLVYSPCVGSDHLDLEATAGLFHLAMPSYSKISPSRAPLDGPYMYVGSES